MSKVDISGVFLHAKHAYMPNKLGYCGPDDRGAILHHLQESSVDERFISTLKNFEAAYPFIRLIGKSNEIEPFNRKVTEAYWIGNRLLSNVPSGDFYKFTISDLQKKNGQEIRSLFLKLRDQAIPHHTFYVLSSTMSIISDLHHSSSPDPRKVSEMMDSCRISWGQVLKVDKDQLLVGYKSLGVSNGKISLSRKLTKKRIKYNPTVQPFEKISPGDYVSMHWNFACEVLSQAQLRNIYVYTQRDVSSVNVFLRAMMRAN
jgi:hypothetical protein